MVRLQLNIFLLKEQCTLYTVLYSTRMKGGRYSPLSNSAWQQERGVTVFPCLHSGHSGGTATGDSTWLPPDLEAMEAKS